MALLFVVVAIGIPGLTGKSKIDIMALLLKKSYVCMLLIKNNQTPLKYHLRRINDL